MFKIDCFSQIFDATAKSDWGQLARPTAARPVGHTFPRPRSRLISLHLTGTAHIEHNNTMLFGQHQQQHHWRRGLFGIAVDPAWPSSIFTSDDHAAVRSSARHHRWPQRQRPSPTTTAFGFKQQQQQQHRPWRRQTEPTTTPATSSDRAVLLIFIIAPDQKVLIRNSAAPIL